MSNKIAIIGGGAAGCFCAIELKRRLPNCEVHIFEAGSKTLAKVAITGGGRCNLTNTFANISNLAEAYPRGDKLIKRIFHSFNNEDTIKWFENEGIQLVTQEDQCIFPKSQDAMTIVDKFNFLMGELGVCLHTSHRVCNIQPGFTLSFKDEKLKDFNCDTLIVTAGGYPDFKTYDIFKNLELAIVEPVPSLFTFNINNRSIKDLAGTVVTKVTTNIVGTKFKANGPLLITDWGMSGPAILKLSSYAARYLSENQYKANLSVNWMGELNEGEVRSILNKIAKENSSKLITNARPNEIPQRLWKLLVVSSGISEDTRWDAIGKKALNKLTNTLINSTYEIAGKSKFKEEFVTCGGIALSNINLNTLESKAHPNLYFGGEILDVDAITGGFNLQAAWSMGFVIANAISSK